MRGIVFVALAAIAALLLAGGCFAPAIQKPAPEGKNCDYNNDCFVKSFLECGKAHGTLAPDENSSFYFQVMGNEGNKCKVYIQLLKAAGVPEFMNGMDAICKMSPAELAQQTQNKGAGMDISKMDCQGPLYEAIKAAQSLQGTK
jgi:hypothetical protein